MFWNFKGFTGFTSRIPLYGIEAVLVGRQSSKVLKGLLLMGLWSFLAFRVVYLQDFCAGGHGNTDLFSMFLEENFLLRSSALWASSLRLDFMKFAYVLYWQKLCRVCKARSPCDTSASSTTSLSPCKSADAYASARPSFRTACCGFRGGLLGSVALLRGLRRVHRELS